MNAQTWVQYQVKMFVAAEDPDYNPSWGMYVTESMVKVEQDH